MEYKEKSLTREGARLFAQAAADETKELVLDKLVVSPTIVPAGTDLSALTLADFKDAKQFNVNNVTQTDASFTATTVVSNEGLTESLSIALIGLLGHVGEDNSNQGIVAVAVGNDPFVLPEDNGTPFRIVPALSVGFSYSDKVTVVVNDDVYVTQANLKSVITSQGFMDETSLEDYLKTHKFATENYVDNAVGNIKLPTGIVSLDEDGKTTSAGEQKGIWVNQAFVDQLKKDILAMIIDPNSGKALIKMDFPYGALTVDGDHVTPIEMVADEAAATAREANHPNTQHEWSED